jgi:trimeric autotransporter adhesin
MESIEKLGERLEAIEHRARMMERRLRWWRILACSLVVVGLVILPLVGGTAQEQSSYERAMARRLAALEYKLQYISGGLNEVVITGANLRIVNGLGTTETTNGLGNLIVGYNELREENPSCLGIIPGTNCTDTRTGSHNLVVGKEHNFSSFGGIVVGDFNEISGDFSSVSGGLLNKAIGHSSSVSGGLGNTASGNFSSVSGGSENTASGGSTSVSGGLKNTVSGFFASSISGGLQNTASSPFSSVSGGQENTASGDSSSVSGGRNNTTNGFGSSVSGGLNRTAPDTFNWAAGPLFAAQ